MKWDKVSIAEFLDAIGQDSMQIKDDLSGTSHGDFGEVRILCLEITDHKELRLVFDSHDEAKLAFNCLTDAMSNPYEFACRFDVMPEVVMVSFTE